MKKLKAIKSVCLEPELIRKIENFQELKEINSFSNTVTKLCEFAIQAFELKPKVESPAFIKSLQEFQKKENIFEWVKALPPDAIQGFKAAIEMELNDRNKNTVYG